MNIILETERFYFRQFTEADAGLFLELNSNPAVVKYVHEAPIADEAAALKVITEIIQPQYINGIGRWAMHLKENNEFIGWCGLKYIKELDETDLGYRFFEHCWGKGYATEAARATLRYGFDQMHIDEIIGRAHIDNIASWKVLEKIGMQYWKENNFCDGPTKVYRINRFPALNPTPF